MRFVAFLRAINVGGHVVKMDRLRRLFEEMGFTNVATFIASGNVIFDSRSSDAVALEKRIEKHLERALGYEVGTYLRSCAELSDVATLDVPNVARDCRVHVVFMKAGADSATKQKLRAMCTKDDSFHAHNREVYWVTRGSFSQSPVAVPFGKLVGGAGTMRSVTTVRKLAAKYKP